jgi:hypothetical protein
MKKIALLAGLFISLCSAFSTEAQVRVNINIGAPVMHERWAAYDNDYYYMPGPGVYYNVRRQVYVYPERGTWVYARRLPAHFGNCSFANTRYYRVHDRAPFQRHTYYRDQYRVAYHNQPRSNQRDQYRKEQQYRGERGGHRRPDFGHRPHERR